MSSGDGAPCFDVLSESRSGLIWMVNHDEKYPLKSSMIPNSRSSQLTINVWMSMIEAFHREYIHEAQSKHLSLQEKSENDQSIISIVQNLEAHVIFAKLDTLIKRE